MTGEAEVEEGERGRAVARSWERQANGFSLGAPRRRAALPTS